MATENVKTPVSSEEVIQDMQEKEFQIILEDDEVMKMEKRIIMHEVPYAPIHNPEVIKIRMPDFWGGGDEPLYTWYEVITVSVSEANSFKYLLIEKHGENLVAHDYIKDEVETLPDSEADYFEPRRIKYFKVVTDMTASEFLKFLLSLIEEDITKDVERLIKEEGMSRLGAELCARSWQYRGILAKHLLYRDENIIEIEIKSNGRIKVNGKEFLIKPEKTEEYLRELDAKLEIAHAKERTLVEWARELLRDLDLSDL
jgi:hypothetical protein